MGGAALRRAPDDQDPTNAGVGQPNRRCQADTVRSTGDDGHCLTERLGLPLVVVGLGHAEALSFS